MMDLYPSREEDNPTIVERKTPVVYSPLEK